MLVIPTIIMLAVTYSSLGITLWKKFLLFREGMFKHSIDGLQAGIAALLLILGILVAFSCAAKLMEKGNPGQTAD